MATITKSIGTVGRDYSTMTLWEADLDNALVYAIGDDALGECYNDSVFDESVTINGGGVIGLNSVSLSVAVGQRHTGIAGTGARMVASVANRQLNLQSLGDATKLIVEWLEWNCNAKAYTNDGVTAGSAAANRVCTIQRMIIHDLLTSTANIDLCDCGARDGRILDNIVYNITATANDRNVRGIVYSGANATGACLNNTCYKVTSIGTGLALGIRTESDNVNTKIRNNISTGHVNNPSAFSFTGAVNLTSSNNLSDDATSDDGGGADNLINQATNQFVSIVAGSEDLHLKLGSTAINTGVDLATTPTGVQFDIDNFDRDTSGVVWDIGADEFTGGTLGGTLPFMGVG